jgi:hypothetical protein
MNELVRKLSSSWQDGINVILGLWLIASPGMLGYMSETTAAWNAWIVGVVVMVAALAALVAFQKWEEWVSMALAAWLIASPWILGFSGLQAAVWNQLIVGVLIGGLALWSSIGEHEGKSFLGRS